jgi:hypothetical protein
MAKQAFQRVDASAPFSVTKFSKRGCSSATSLSGGSRSSMKRRNQRSAARS